jgi:hypothetical protein
MFKQSKDEKSCFYIRKTGSFSSLCARYHFVCFKFNVGWRLIRIKLNFGRALIQIKYINRNGGTIREVFVSTKSHAALKQSKPAAISGLSYSY